METLGITIAVLSILGWIWLNRLNNRLDGHDRLSLRKKLFDDFKRDELNKFCRETNPNKNCKACDAVIIDDVQLTELYFNIGYNYSLLVCDLVNGFQAFIVAKLPEDHKLLKTTCSTKKLLKD